MLEFDTHHIDAVMAKGVNVTMPQPRPVDKFNAELIGRPGLAHELIFIDAEQVVEQADIRDACFANTDSANDIGFDKLNVQPRQRAEHSRKCRRRHPSGGTTADDHHFANGIVIHGCTLRTSDAAHAPAFRKNSSCVGSASAVAV